jgi:urease gamma subunit
VTEPDRWNCSDKQRELILKITEEHKLDKTKVDQLAMDRFGKGVKSLNKLEASGLIDELLVQNGQAKPRNGRFQKAGGR